ncbi:hypothetical protein CCGE525_15260 [Rhizobium jaguaris]|uniref:Uncharacterized protein n=1 Tax=Rhizobium jaguaris TaxID=1312183 RepID=A0A387FQR9_9HYPH|nr:hypothetical protein CCGE525_15260 [Rhizobium jaguaris]
MIGRCAMCKRQLDLEGDPLSGNTGGDCWGCVGHMEAFCGGDPQENISIGFVAKEIEWGWRERDGRPKPQSFFLSNPQYWPSE